MNVSVKLYMFLYICSSFSGLKTDIIRNLIYVYDKPFCYPILYSFHRCEINFKIYLRVSMGSYGNLNMSESLVTSDICLIMVLESGGGTEYHQ